MEDAGIVEKSEPLRKANTFKRAELMRFAGLDVLDDNGQRKRLPDDTRRYETMKEREEDRKNELKKDIEHFGDPF